MMNSTPIDLIYEILSRLPAKSVARCRCVSKLWRRMLGRQDFTELFLTRSKARPRLLIEVKQDGEWSFYTMPQPQNPYENSSRVVAADFHIKLSKGISLDNCSYVSGLIYCSILGDENEKRVICNPLTGQYVILPELTGDLCSYLGFDPVDKEFKILFMNVSGYTAYNNVDHYILTLGTGKGRWRKIQCPFTHLPMWHRICINGVLYYLALHGGFYVIVCFDVRSEKFKFIYAEYSINLLINYKGKLCGIDLDDNDGGFPLKLSMWVLEDVEKQEWSKYVYSLCAESKVVKVARYLSVSGMTATGDIVLSANSENEQFYYVFYFNPERNTLQSVEIQGVGANQDLLCIDYIEDLSVTSMILLA